MFNMRCRTFGSIIALCACASISTPALPQAYPSKPIRIICQFNAGTPGDLIARVVAALMTENLGQAVVVDNRSGAGGVVAVQAVVRSAPDGYTLVAANASIPTVLPVLSAKPLPFDPPEGPHADHHHR